MRIISQEQQVHTHTHTHTYMKLVNCNMFGRSTAIFREPHQYWKPNELWHNMQCKSTTVAN